MSGIKVGSVTGVSLQQAARRSSRSPSTAAVALGSETTAHIRTGTLLGQRILTLESAGSGQMHRGDVIPVSRTSSPYSLTEAVSDLTTNTAGTDTADAQPVAGHPVDDARPDRAATGPDVRRPDPAVAVAQRSQRHAARAARRARATSPGSWPQRSQQLNTLILNANDLIGVLNDRREAIVDLLANTSAVSKQLSGLVADNEKELAPTLDEAQLGDGDAGEEPRQHRQGAARPGEVPDHPGRGRRQRLLLRRLRPQPVAGADSCSRSSTTHSASGAASTPVSRPTTPGPRAEFPLPYNGIPGGSAMKPRRRETRDRGRSALAVLLRRRRGRRWSGSAFFAPDHDHRVLHQRHRDLSRRRGPGARASRSAPSTSIEPVGGQAKMMLDVDRGVPDPRRRQGGHRRPEPGRRAVRPARPGLRDQRPDDGRRRGDPGRADRHSRRVGRGQDPIDAAGNRSGPAQRRRPARRCPGSSTAPPTRWTATATSCVRRWPTVRCGAHPGRRQRQHRRHHQEPADLRHARCATATSRSCSSRTGSPR